MDRLQTLGDVVTCGLAIFAAIFVPWAILRARAPQISAAITTFIMSRRQVEPIEKADTGAVHVPVPSTDTSDDTAWEMPRTSRHNTDAERIVYLAAQLESDGKYRFSANKIADFMGGTRADVLEQVKAVRTSPTYQPLTPEKQPV